MSHISSPRRTLIAILAIIAVGVLFVTFASFRSHSIDDPQPAEIEIITIRPVGFEPAEITRAKGPFVLFLEDGSGKDNSSLVLQRLNGERLRTITLERKQSNWNEVVDLAPGTYLLHDGTNDQLRCQITILP